MNEIALNILNSNQAFDMLNFDKLRAGGRYVWLLRHLIIALLFVGGGLNAQAQSCGAACGSGDEVEIEFYGRGEAAIVSWIDNYVESVGMQLGGTGNTLDAFAYWGSVTPLQKLEHVKDDIIYGGLFLRLDGYMRADNSGFGLGDAYFRMVNGCGKTLQVRTSITFDESNPQRWSEWVDVPANGPVHLRNTHIGYYSEYTYQFQIRVLKKEDGSSGPSSETSITNPPTVNTSGGQGPQVNPATISSRTSLGSTPQSSGYNTGSISIAGHITPSLANIANLRANEGAGNSVVMNSGSVRQLKNAVRLADVQEISGGGFEVRFYEEGSFGGGLVGDLYPINPGAVSSGTVSYIPIPAQLGVHQGGVRVLTATPGQATKVVETVSTSGQGDSWRVSESIGGSGADVRDYASAFLPDGDQLQRIDLAEVRRDGVFVSKHITTYLLQTRMEGTPAVVVESNDFVLSETIFDTETTSTTTSWEPDPTKIGRAKYVIRPDRTWEVYSYYTGNESIANGDPVNADATWADLLKQTLKPHQGAPANASLATVTNSLSTLIVYEFPSASSGSFDPQQTRRTTYLPGGTIKISDWEKTSAPGNVASLISTLGDAGISPAWLPLPSNIRSEAGTEYASAGEGISSSSYYYNRSHVAGSTWTGRSFASLDAEGNGSATGYQHGIYDFGSGVFTPNNPAGNQSAWGSDVRSITVKIVAHGLSPASGEATREISINDRFGKPLRTELAIKADSGIWSPATATTYEYPAYWPDGRVKETIIRQDGRIISRTLNEVSGSDSLTTVWDEQGIETRTLTDASGRTKTVTQVGVAAQDGHQAQPDRVTDYTYSGQTTTTVMTAGGLSRTQESVVDLAGRTVSETDSSGATTLTSYPNAGRDSLTTLPGGLTRLVTNDLDGRMVSVTGSGVMDEFYDYDYSTTGAAPGNLITMKRMGDLPNSPRYQSSEQDWAGRSVNSKSPSPTGIPGEIVTTVSGYQPNTRRLISTQSASGLMFFQKPAANSETTYSGYDLDNSLALEPAGIDRVSESNRRYVLEEGYWWQVATQKNYDVNGSAASAITTISKRCLHGMPGGLASKSVSISSGGETTTVTTSIDRTKKIVIRTETTTASTVDAVSKTVNGLLVSRKARDTSSLARWEYDGLGQVLKEITPHGASNGKTYYADGSLHTATDFAGKTTTFEYYGPTHQAAGKVSQMTNPFGKTTTYLYSDLGQVTEEAGTASYKVSYEYDEYGFKKKMFTWRDATTSDATEWIYQPATGVLDAKKDAAGKSVSYTYYPSGQIHVRTWARTPHVATTYSYQVPGDLTDIDYSDATPDVALTGFDRLGRPTTITQTGIGTETLSYHPGKGTESARFYGLGHSLLPGIGLRSSVPDASGRPSGFEETSGADTAVVRSVSYGYDASGRFETITDGANRHVYSYHPNSSLVSTIESRDGGSSWFRESRFYDKPTRLVGIRSDRMSGNAVTAMISTHGYKHDDLGRRTRNTFQDGSYWEYGYNDRSEVTSAMRKTSAGTVIPQLAASYDYDGIGNRLSSISPILGNHTYTPNSLNQYASITTGNSRTAIGRAPAAWNVEVDGVAAGRTGELYHRPITATNGAAPVWKEVVTRRDTGAPSSTGHFWYAATPFSPVYDEDGNLTNDGRWSYLWDAENRLIQMKSTPEAVTAGHPYTKVVNAYDWQGRRIAKHVWKGGTAGSPIFASSHRWLYNGWNEIAELSASSDTATTLTRQNIFTWGLDLSGTLQGAGGVGGLLVQTTVANGVKEDASYDGNGNIVAWTKSTASAPTSRREYDAFGNTLVSEGNWPSSFGFSTKMQDAETGLYYYGYRFYDPMTGSWISKDFLGELGGINLHQFVKNNAVGNWDLLGMVHRPGGIAANIDQIPAIMSRNGWSFAWATMSNWFARSMGDSSPADNILTVAWAEKFNQFNVAVTDIKSRATNVEAAKELKSKLSSHGIVVTGAIFDHTTGKASSVDNYYYQSSAITTHSVDDFGFAVGKANIHMVAKGSITATDICVTDVGYYLVDPYRFNEPEDQRLGVWDFNEMEFEGLFEMITSGAEYRVFNSSFVEYSLRYRKGSDFLNYSDIKTYKLSSPWQITR